MGNTEDTVNQDEYLRDRLDDQIDWYGGKAAWNQKWYKRLQVVSVLAAALIPFLSGYMSEEIPAVKLTIGGLGFFVAAITALLGLYRFHENWIEYRAASEALKGEKFRYLTRVAPYDGNDPFPLLVTRVESLLSGENANWARTAAGAKGDVQTPSSNSEPE